jgi:hypothetical protein
MKDAPRFAYCNPLDLPRIDYNDIIGNRADGVYVEQPEQARTFVRTPPSFHDDPDDAHLFPPFQEVIVTYPPIFTTSLRNVSLQGFRTVLSREGFFTSDVGHLDRADVQDFACSLAGSEELTNLTKRKRRRLPQYRWTSNCGKPRRARCTAHVGRTWKLRIVSL